MVVKSDSRREPFDRRKIWAAIDIAENILFSAETMNKMVSKD
jgi:transcriptional regulator NrdR family protein